MLTRSDVNVSYVAKECNILGIAYENETGTYVGSAVIATAVDENMAHSIAHSLTLINTINEKVRQKQKKNEEN